MNAGEQQEGSGTGGRVGHDLLGTHRRLGGLALQQGDSGKAQSCVRMRRVVLQHPLKALLTFFEQPFIQAGIRKEHQQRRIVG